MSNYDPNYIEQKVFARVGGKAIILNEQGRILMMKRTAKLGGKWSLAGGALDMNEDPYAGIQREIREETNIEVTDLKPFTLRAHPKTAEDADYVIIIGYLCKAKTHIVSLNWEHDEYRWLTKDEALTLDLTPDGRFFVLAFTPRRCEG